MRSANTGIGKKTIAIYCAKPGGQVPGSSYICSMTSSTHPFSVDGRVYHYFMDVDLELYTDTRTGWLSEKFKPCV